MVAQRTTVDRLDKPSAYFNNRVKPHDDELSSPSSRTDLRSRNLQNKRRRPDRRDGDDDFEARQDQPEPEDPLKDATTLYVGNL